MAWTQRERNTGHTSIINRTLPRLLGNDVTGNGEIAGSKNPFRGLPLWTQGKAENWCNQVILNAILTIYIYIAILNVTSRKRASVWPLKNMKIYPFNLKILYCLLQSLKTHVDR